MLRLFPLSLLLTLLVLATSCQAPAEEPAPDAAAPVVSLLGDTLLPPVLSDERRAALEADLAEARATYDADPNDAEAIIWLGRRLGYLWRYHDAIDVFTEGLEEHPGDARFYRHRGHRYLSVRAFERAEEDLERAAELIEGTVDVVEPDGAPNAAGIPRSTLHTNIWYHLGLARYLQGDFEGATEAYQRGLGVSPNDDMLVATTDWAYMTLRRLGRNGEADVLLTAIEPEMDVLENDAYHRRLLMYKGTMEPEALLTVEDDADRALTLATQGYGVANWYLVEGDTARAQALYRDVLDGDYWPAFGYIAAEADLRRLGEAS